MPSKPTKNDVAWRRLFATLPIDLHLDSVGFFDITSKQINAVREARLMTKFDTASARPAPFKERRLQILPIRRGTYRLAQMDLYETIPKVDWQTASNSQKFSLRADLHTLTAEALKSETVALNAALTCGMLEHFVGEGDLAPTASGRMSTGSLSFKVKVVDGRYIPIEVDRAQMEIDGCFESHKSVVLVEAKTKFANNFLIRQLFYPYQYWTTRIDKKIRSIFQVYSNETFHFFEYTFEPGLYNSIQLDRQQSFRMQDRILTQSDIFETLESAQLGIENAKDFPQADAFERVLSFIETLRDRGEMTNKDVAEHFNFSSRQGAYYSKSARYLGLIETNRSGGQDVHHLSALGRVCLSKDFAERQLMYAAAILERPVFNASLWHYFDRGDYPSKTQVIEWMSEHGVTDEISGSTVPRRASTVLGWTRWITSLAEDP